MDRVLERVGLPAVVKPSRGGSSMGITFVERAADFTGAVMSGLSFSDAVVVEARVTGTEVAAGFVGSPPEALPLVEIVPKSGVYDYAARYTPGATEYFAPARLDEGTAAATAGARRAFEALGLEQVGRTDLIVDDEGVAWILEVNVSPGMTETSLLPMAAQAAGYTLPDFCTRVLELALARA
jgi:D-alanine-D-alanine ligase